MGEAPCTTCFGEGKIYINEYNGDLYPIKPIVVRHVEIVCISCKGTGKELEKRLGRLPWRFMMRQSLLKAAILRQVDRIGHVVIIHRQAAEGVSGNVGAQTFRGRDRRLFVFAFFVVAQHGRLPRFSVHHDEIQPAINAPSAYFASEAGES